MRTSCNGCRALRKGCSDDCSIKPCLQWIKTPDSQAHATVFLAKFYGRAGLLNLVNAGPTHLRPAIFRSLLYEACGRIVNPIYGSVGLLWSGNWQLCQDAVEAVLKGSPITKISSETAETDNGPPLKAYDIRHIPKDDNTSGSNQLHRVRNRCRFKKSAAKKQDSSSWVQPENECTRSPSHESALSHLSEVAINLEASKSLAREDSAEAEGSAHCGADGEIELELTLGLSI